MNKMKHGGIGRTMRLTIFITVVSLLIQMIVVGISMLCLRHFGYTTDEVHRFSMMPPFGISLGAGLLISFIVARTVMKQMEVTIEAIDSVAKGDYSVRLTSRLPKTKNNFVDSFNKMAEELGRVELLKSDFINTFSHEFKTPIVSIKGFANILKNDTLTPQERGEYLDIIIEESERLSELSTSVLNLSKLEHTVTLTDTADFDIVEQLRQVVGMLNAKIEEKQLDLVFAVQERAEVNGNKELLKQVFINLLDNAIKFSPKFGSVTIRLEETKGNVTFSITNTGEAIEAEDAEHIFDKFFQSERSRSISGNGLGLSIARQIIDLHGGKLTLKDNTDGRVTFEFKLKR